MAGGHDKLEASFYFPFKNKIHTLHFTGGEPTLHPDMEKLIVSSYDNNYEIELTTNCILIKNYNANVLRLISNIDTSVYGLSNDEYRINTEINNGFDKYVSSCEYFSKSHINYTVGLVVNKPNIFHIEDYAKMAISVNTPCFRLGLPTLSGKLLDQNQDAYLWSLTKEDISYAYRQLRESEQKYGDVINIKVWQRKNYSKIPQSTSNALKCSAGRDLGG